MVQLKPEDAARQAEAERQPLSREEALEWKTKKEREDGQILVDVTGADFDRALRMLRKHDGDMEKAANSLLNNPVEDAEERSREESLANIKENFGHLFENQNKSREHDAARSNGVIDLTGDNDNDPPMDTTTRFRATTRSPDPAWQMVPTNRTTKSEDDQLNEALKASWNDFAADESDAMLAEDVVPREGGRPIALRADVASKAYAALVIQCLFHIPQVRQRCSKLHPHSIDEGKPRFNPDAAMWSLIEMFTALDLGEVNVYLDEDLLNDWETAPLGPSDPVGNSSRSFLDQVVKVVQADLDEQQIETGPNFYKLFNFTHCRVHIPATGPPERVSPGPTNELVARLSQQLNTYNPDGSSTHHLIQRPSEIVTFEIAVIKGGFSTSGGGASPEPFAYPKCIYMDQFLEANVDLANETRASQMQIQKDLEQLAKKRRDITRFEDQDTFENLRGAIDYYENMAQCDSPERLATLRSMATKLKNALKKLESEVTAIDAKITILQQELDGLWDNPELKCHPYDLRAVLVHTGLPGRKQIYSYVQDKGTWWKTVDYTVTEVSEDLVLSDPSGLHLGAGPYMLMYSRRQSESEINERVQWPPFFVERTLKNNANFLNDPKIKNLEGANSKADPSPGVATGGGGGYGCRLA
ncbi:Glycoside hydrolase family 79 protein [Mycena sanguinolenta]|uniref:Glycoside hydrolase family 79 protein n=1 Tax=Mycena sanguinolenta TaxID=230812 RepID=A0A8H6Y1Z0_9AGAR|nr:Glycoside hydrolase family 79 protein [Mycena sanguinolenta]